MAKSSRAIGSGLLLALLASASFSASAARAPASPSKASANQVYSDGKRKWIAQDSVKVRYFFGSKTGGFIGVHGGTGSDVFWPSPDGTRFVFLTQRGDDGCNCNIATIAVYNVDDIIKAIATGERRPPAPVRTLEMRGVSPSRDGEYSDGRAVGSAPYWTDDGGSVRFSGYDKSGIPQTYQLAIATGKLTQLTALSAKNESVGAFQAKGGSVIYQTITVTKSIAQLNYPNALSRTRLAEFKVKAGLVTKPRFRVMASGQGNGPWLLASSLNSNLLQLSPDGRYGLIERAVPVPPPHWMRYKGSNRVLEGQAILLEPQFPQFVLVDLKTKEELPLFDAPSGSAVGSLRNRWAFWSQDSRKIIIGNTALPLQSGKGKDDERASTAYIISYDVEQREYKILQPFIDHATGLTADGGLSMTPGRRVLVTHRTKDELNAESIVYSYEQGEWRPGKAGTSDVASAGEAKPVLAQGLKLELRQDANTPPVVIASHNGRELALTGPDPALANLWITPTEPFTWTDSEGKKQTGGLLMPRERRADGKPIPLVIQLEGYLPDEFKPDGANVLAVASQALAAQGVAVLNVNIPASDESGLQAFRRPRLMADMIDRIVVSLAKSSGIDPDRVGLVGFSYMGFLTRYAITHPGKIKPAAAIVADSAVQDYSWYINGCAASERGCGSTASHGERRFFEDKQAWLDTDLSFNADKASGPILFVSNGESATGSDFLSIGGTFNAARRPHEIMALEPGSQGHIMMHPSTRESSLGATVDWFRFWFFGDEIVQPRDPGRQARWARIRADWEAQQAWEARGYPVGSVPNDRNTINASAYRALYEEKDVAKAIRFLEDNVRLNPRAGFAHDSLGEGYVMAGDIARALEAYDKAEQLAPKQNPNATRIPQALRADPASLAKVQQSLRNAYAAYKAYLNGPVGHTSASSTSTRQDGSK